MHFNEEGFLEFTSSQISEKMKTKYDLRLSRDEPLHYRNIFSNCGSILDILNMVTEQPENYYSSIHDAEDSQPKFHVIS